MTNIEAYEATMDQQLRNYILTKDNEVMSAFHSYFELHEHNVNHILQSYEDSLNTHIQNMTIELWNSLDTELNVNSIAPVQNQAIANAFFSLENSFNTHNHNENYYLKSEVDTFLNNKVDKIEGYGLSQENFTTELKNKLNNLILISESSENAIRGIKGPNSAVRTGQIVEIDKSMIDLSNVDNTHDLDKPISTATQLVLNTKAPIDSPNFTGIPAIGAEPGVNPPAVDKQIATKGYVDDKVALINITSPDTALNINSNNTVTNRAIALALNSKADLTSPNFTGTPTINAITGADNTSKEIVTKGDIQTIIENYENQTEDDVVFFTVNTTNPPNWSTLEEYVSSTAKHRMVVLKISATFANNETRELYCPYLYRNGNYLYFGNYVPDLNRFYYYIVDPNGVSVNDIGIPSTENMALTGIPTAPDAALGINTNQIANTRFVQNAINNLNLRIVVIDFNENGTRTIERDGSTVSVNSNFLDIDAYYNNNYYIIIKGSNQYWLLLNQQIEDIVTTVNDQEVHTYVTAYYFVDFDRAVATDTIKTVFHSVKETGWSTVPAGTSSPYATIDYVQSYVQNQIRLFINKSYVRSAEQPSETNIIWIDIASGYEIPKIFINGQVGWQPLTSVWTA